MARRKKGARAQAPRSAPRPMDTGAKATAESPERATAWTPGLVPLALALIAYARTLSFGLTFLDDNVVDDQAPFLSHLANAVTAFGHLDLLKAYYRPLVTASFVVDAQWNGAAPLAYHVTNLALHLLAVALVYQLLTRLRLTPWAAAFGASVFSVHPALVEAVAWIPGRNDLLFTVFALGAWVLLALDIERPALRLRLAHVGAFLAALFSKETAVVLPLLFCVHRWAVDVRSIDWRRSLLPSKRHWPLWIASLGVYGVVRLAVVSSEHRALGPDSLRLAEQLPVLLTSLGKLGVPWDLSPLATFRDSTLWPGVVAVAIVTAIAASTRWPRPRLLGLAASTFLLPLLPTLFVTDRLTLENRFYLPAVGLCLFIAEAVDCWRRGHPGRPRVMALINAALLGGALVKTWMYSGSYRDRGALSAAAVSSSPHSALAHLHLGDFYYKIDHDLDGAESEYRRAIDLDPREPVVHNNLGVLLLARKQFAQAESQFDDELSTNPNYAPAHYNRGLALRNLNRGDEAAREWELTLREDPGHINAMGELMVYHFSHGDSAGGMRYREQLSAAGVRFASPPATPVAAPTTH